MENFTFDRLRGILNQMGVRVIEECGLTALVFRDDDLPNSLGVFFLPRDGKIIVGSQVVGMSFEGTRRVKGLEYCNEWNDARGAARASLDQAGVLHLVQTLFVDGPLTDEYVRNFAGRFLQEANEFYKEAASKFF